MRAEILGMPIEAAVEIYLFAGSDIRIDNPFEKFKSILVMRFFNGGRAVGRNLHLVSAHVSVMGREQHAYVRRHPG